LTREQLEILRLHLQQKKGGLSTRTPRLRGPKPKPPPKPAPKYELAKYEKDVPKITQLQRKIKSWYRIHRFKEIAMEFLTADGSEKQRKRNMALWEVVSSETVYVHQLEELDRTIIQPLKAESHSFITENQIDMLFSNIESILCLNGQLLEAMKDKMDMWPSEQRFADIFIKKAPVLRLYGEYINNYGRQLEVWNSLEAKKPQFKEWTKQQSKVSLTNYLILPVQRIPRYEILLQSLLRYTDKDHADHKNILAALKKVEELNVLADAKKKEEDNRKTLTEIQQSFSGGPSLLVAHRFFFKRRTFGCCFS